MMFPLAFHLVLLVAFQRDARHETWYALFLFDPIPHELRKVLRTPIALSDELHLRVLSLAIWLKDECGIEIVLRRDPDLAVGVEGKLHTKDGGNRLSELRALSREDLQRGG